MQRKADYYHHLALVICLAVSSLTATRVVAQDHEVAARFAPVFYQGLGDRPRNDYITNFDFDGDWRGDNNWANADERRFPLRAYVYYAVSETATHYFIHYAVFHPRDYKGNALLSELMREGTKRGSKYDPTGQLFEISMAHENDLEGCLVVVAKNGDTIAQARVMFVETLAHGKFLRYVAEGSSLGGFERLSLEGERPRLYVEPKGHGIQAYREDGKQRPRRGILTYSFNARADYPEQNAQTSISYDLIQLYNTLWPRARRGVNETYGEAHDYGSVTVSTVGEDGRSVESRVKLGMIGSAFLGRVGAHNMARPPWGWADRDEPAAPRGAWFFDPARTIKRHFNAGSEFSTSYLYAPFLGVARRK